MGLYASLPHDGLSQHKAWRAAFAIVPVPVLLFTALIVVLFGTDHPAGKWSQRHTLPATAAAIAQGHNAVLDHDEKFVLERKARDKEAGGVTVREAEAEEGLSVRLHVGC